MTDITDEQIRKMAYASGLDCEVIGGLDGLVLERLRRFAELARSDLWGDGNTYMRTDDAFNLMELARQEEREACARLCNELGEMNKLAPTDSAWQWGECASAIRARGSDK